MPSFRIRFTRTHEHEVKWFDVAGADAYDYVEDTLYVYRKDDDGNKVVVFLVPNATREVLYVERYDPPTK